MISSTISRMSKLPWTSSPTLIYFWVLESKKYGWENYFHHNYFQYFFLNEKGCFLFLVKRIYPKYSHYRLCNLKKIFSQIRKNLILNIKVSKFRYSVYAEDELSYSRWCNGQHDGLENRRAGFKFWLAQNKFFCFSIVEVYWLFITFIIGI